MSELASTFAVSLRNQSTTYNKTIINHFSPPLTFWLNGCKLALYEYIIIVVTQWFRCTGKRVQPFRWVFFITPLKN